MIFLGQKITELPSEELNLCQTEYALKFVIDENKTTLAINATLSTAANTR